MKKLFIETYGCQMNVADSEVVAAVMQMAGYEVCERIDDADAVFLNTCSVRDNAEQKIYGRLDTLNAERRKGHKMIIGVLGCMAERVREDLLQNHHADLVAGPDAYMSLPDLIAQAETGHKAINIDLSTTETYGDVVPQRLHTARGGLREHHEGLQQLLPLLHSAIHQGPREKPRPEEHHRRGARPAGPRIQRGDAARPERQLVPL